MALSIAEGFDSVTAPALPAGWSFDSPYITSTSQRVSTPNAITVSGAVPHGNNYAIYGAADSTSNTWTVACSTYFNISNSSAGPIFSASSSTPGSGSMYHVSILYHGTAANQKLQFRKTSGGTTTPLASLSPGTAMFSIANWYILSVVGTYSGSTTTVDITVQDSVTGEYLDSTGAWVVGSTVALHATDGSAISPNYYGLIMESPTGTPSVFIDNWTLNSSLVSGPASTPWHLFFQIM